MAPKPSYNPFYVPSLDAIKAQASQEARAQVDAAVAAIPTDLSVQSSFGAAGRDYAGMDQQYIDFINNLRVARVGQGASTVSTAPNFDPSGQVGSTVSGARAAASALGIGFENQFAGLAASGAAYKNVHQQQNRSAMQTRLQELADQRAAERAKYGALYQDAYNRKKQEAFQAYQAYLSSQAGAAQLGAQISSDQANQNLQQQQLQLQRDQATG